MYPENRIEKSLRIIAWTSIVIAVLLGILVARQFTWNPPEVIQLNPPVYDGPDWIFGQADVHCQFLGNFQEFERKMLEDSARISGVGMSFLELTFPITSYDPESGHEIEVAGFSMWYCGSAQDLENFWDVYDMLKNARG